MSVARPVRCIFSASTTSIRPRSQCRAFHASPCLPERKRSRFRSIKASEMTPAQLEAANRPTSDFLKPYTEQEKEELAKHFTPDQLKAIEAGEEAVDLEDIRSHGFLRTDPYRLKYLDDLSTIEPVIDKRPRFDSTVPDDAEPLNDEQAFDEVSQWIGDVYEESLLERPLGETEDPTMDELTSSLGDGSKSEDPLETKIWQSRPSATDLFRDFEESTGMTGGGKDGSYSTAPALPKIEGLGEDAEGDSSEIPSGNKEKLSHFAKLLGLDPDHTKNFILKSLVSHRVMNQTRLGKIQSTYTLAICGNKNGRIGLGEGKATEPEDARDKAQLNAMRNMVPIPRYEQRTIFGEMEAKVSGVVVRLMSRPPGFGLRCQHNIFEICRAAGITDIAARTPRSRNKMNVCKAVWQALQNQRIPDEIARGRGKKLVDVRKVYYGGDQFVDAPPERRRRFEG